MRLRIRTDTVQKKRKNPDYIYCSKDLINLTSTLILGYDKLFNQLNNYEKMTIQNGILSFGIGQLYLELKYGLHQLNTLFGIERVLELARVGIGEDKVRDKSFVINR